ncbi:MAG: RHH-type transcriptional regulator, proline utilization regulon repressor / proline dehydrogenase, partial [Ilumatobacteraceae bacterium]
AEMVTGIPTTIDRDAAQRSYGDAWNRWFGRAHDPTGLASERNELRYRHLDEVVVRVGRDTPEGAVAAARLAAEISGTPLRVSDASVESDAELIDRLNASRVERLRLLTDASEELRAACYASGIEIDTEPVSVSGRRELRRWLREQAISRTTHRHGRVAP